MIPNRNPQLISTIKIIIMALILPVIIGAMEINLPITITTIIFLRMAIPMDPLITTPIQGLRRLVFKTIIGSMAIMKPIAIIIGPMARSPGPMVMDQIILKALVIMHQAIPRATMVNHIIETQLLELHRQPMDLMPSKILPWKPIILDHHPSMSTTAT
jgi:hypothetical protein